MSLVVGVNASRNRSGGAKAHLIGVLRDADPRAHGIDTVHLWSYRALLDAVPDAPWLVKHSPPALERSLMHQALWEVRSLPREARLAGCEMLLNTDAGSVCPFRPAVTMSRDMLSFEGRERHRYGWSKARIRLGLLRLIQTRSLRQADGAIFLTNYAADVIQKVTGPLPRVAIIPHGVSAAFRRRCSDTAHDSLGAPIRMLYVSNAAMYKHQWHVIHAAAALRARGYPVSLTLAGGGSGRAQRLVDDARRRFDPYEDFVRAIGAVNHDDLPALLGQADLFIFASSCENMPNTLVEAMASGLPIACSDRGPMPEVLQDGGVYFDPEIPGSIADALERLITNASLRRNISRRARERSELYSWARCGGETWEFLHMVCGAGVDEARSGA